MPTVDVWLLKLQIHCWWDDGVWWSQTKTLSEWDVTSVIINSLFSTLFSLSSPPNSSHSDQYPEPGKSSSQHFLPRWQIFSGQRSNTWLERDQPPFNIKINILNSPHSPQFWITMMEEISSDPLSQSKAEISATWVVMNKLILRHSPSKFYTFFSLIKATCLQHISIFS